jgi:hypothetical protein
VKPARSGDGRRVWVARAIIGIALAASIAAAIDLRRQYESWSYGQMAEAQNMARVRGDASVNAFRVGKASGASPQAELYRALIFARSAEQEKDMAQRGQILSAASVAVRNAERGRPDWGAAMVVDAYIDSIADGRRVSDAMVERLAQSYRFAPYLRDAGGWRVQMGLAVWDRLPVEARGRVIDEGVWLGRISADARVKIFDAARRSPAYALFSARWLENRRGDADLLAAGYRAAP